MRRLFIAAAICALGVSLAPCAHGARHGRHAHHRAHHGHRPPQLPVKEPGAPGEGMKLDPATGNYRISYYPPPTPPTLDGKPVAIPVSAVSRPAGAEKALLHATFVPATKIDPTVDSDFVYRADRREVQYAYRIANGRAAKQALVQVIIEPLSNVSALQLPPRHVQGVDAARIPQLETYATMALITPDNWSGLLTTSPDAGLRIVWQFAASAKVKGVAPGRAQTGFGMPADDLPGVVLAKLMGDAPAPEFKGPWPGGDFGDRLSYLLAHNYVTRPVAVPAIGVPDPYDPVELIRRIQDQMHGWIALRLLDPLFSERLDHYLAAAADELSHARLQAARYDLDAVHLLLAVQQPSLAGEDGRARLVSPTAMQIELLPARVLDFDLKYLEMRM